MRPKDAAPFSLKLGEDRHGEDIQIPLGKLHSVRGVITSAYDSHVINGGEVALYYPDDKIPVSSASVTRDDSGFTFSFVPEGDYILRVEYAADVEYDEIPNPPHSTPPTRTETRMLRSYGSADLRLHIDGELSGVIVAVPDLPGQRIQPTH
jgi:hypothetical protein